MISEILATPVTAQSYGWRLERGDGVTLGFTSHDRDMLVDGLLLQASPGLEPTSIVDRMGFEQGGLEVRGALTADALTPDDIAAGRWDGAALDIFSFDWTLAEPAMHMLASGTLGTISYTGDRFETVFNGPAAQLGQSVAPFSSPTCRANFCDKACGLNRRRFVTEVQIQSSMGSRLLVDPSTSLGVEQYTYGTLRWLEGQNCGLTADIVRQQNGEVDLAVPPEYAILTATRAELLQGCDKTIATCADRFGNAVNFRGEPYLPGNDLLTRYPGAN